MPNLNVVIPTPLAATLNDAVARRVSSLDSIVTAALSQYFEIDRHRAYQISTSAALVQGASDGAVSSQTLLAHGDFGLGTFEHLDGEMVVLDGDIYQVRADGSVQRRRDNFRIPFAVVSRFQPDESFDVASIDGLEALAKACDPHRESDNLFYALRVDGFFARIHTRAVKAPLQAPGLRLRHRRSWNSTSQISRALWCASGRHAIRALSAFPGITSISSPKTAPKAVMCWAAVRPHYTLASRRCMTMRSSSLNLERS